MRGRKEKIQKRLQANLIRKGVENSETSTRQSITYIGYLFLGDLNTFEKLVKEHSLSRPDLIGHYYSIIQSIIMFGTDFKKQDQNSSVKEKIDWRTFSKFFIDKYLMVYPLFKEVEEERRKNILDPTEKLIDLEKLKYDGRCLSFMYSRELGCLAYYKEDPQTAISYLECATLEAEKIYTDFNEYILNSNILKDKEEKIQFKLLVFYGRFLSELSHEERKKRFLNCLEVGSKEQTREELISSASFVGAKELEKEAIYEMFLVKNPQYQSASDSVSESIQKYSFFLELTQNATALFAKLKPASTWTTRLSDEFSRFSEKMSKLELPISEAQPVKKGYFNELLFAVREICAIEKARLLKKQKEQTSEKVFSSLMEEEETRRKEYSQLMYSKKPAQKENKKIEKQEPSSSETLAVIDNVTSEKGVLKTASLKTPTLRVMEKVPLEKRALKIAEQKLESIFKLLTESEDEPVERISRRSKRKQPATKKQKIEFLCKSILKAPEIKDDLNNFKAHILIGDCYRLAYSKTKNEKRKEKAISFYEEAKSLYSTRSDNDEWSVWNDFLKMHFEELSVKVEDHDIEEGSHEFYENVCESAEQTPAVEEISKGQPSIVVKEITRAQLTPVVEEIAKGKPIATEEISKHSLENPKKSVKTSPVIPVINYATLQPIYEYIFLPVDPIAQAIGNVLINAGYSVWIVGGAVRDYKLGKVPRDHDLATQASMDEIVKLYSRNGASCKVAGKSISFPHVVLFRFGGKLLETPIQISTLRQRPPETSREGFKIDEENQKGKIICHELYGKSILDDAYNRDAAINAEYYDLATHINCIIFLESKADMQQKVIHVIGVPEKRFTQDPNRMLRMLGLAAQLKNEGYRLHESVIDAIKICKEKTRWISPPHLYMQLYKLFFRGYAFNSFCLLEESKFLEVLFPSVSYLKDKNSENYKAFLRFLDSMDECFSDGKHLSTSLFFAVFLWPCFLEKLKSNNNGHKEFNEMADNVLYEICKITEIPTETFKQVKIFWFLYLKKENNELLREAKLDISNYKIDFRDYNKPAKAMPLFSSVVKSYQEENIEANQNTEKKPGRNARRREAKWRKRDGQQEPAKASSTAVLEQKPAQLMAKVGTFRKNPNAEKGSNDDVKSVNQHLQEGF